MNWINCLFYMVLLTTITGSIMFVIWKGLTLVLSKNGYYRNIYKLLVLIIPFWILPVLYLYIWNDTHKYDFKKKSMAIRRNMFEMTNVIERFEYVIAALWLIGAIAVVVTRLLGYYRLKKSVLQRAFTANREIQMCASRIQTVLDLSRSVQILECYGIDSAIVVGTIKAKIILPVKDYTEQELEAVLYHELIHVRHHILFWKFVVSAIEDIYWFNLFSYWMSRELDYWAEVDCDMKACFVYRGNYTIQEYFMAAFELAQKGEGLVKGKHVTQATLFGKINHLKERVQKVKTYSMERKKLGKAAAAGIIAILYLGSAGTAYAAGLGVQNVMEHVYDRTITNVIDQTPQPVDDAVEYVELFDENAQPVVVEDSMQGKGKAIHLTDWNIASGALHRTSYVSLSAGDEVTVSVGIEPGDKKVRVGLISSDNTKRYIVASDQATHTFHVDKTGRYCVFIENISDAAVKADGIAFY